MTSGDSLFARFEAWVGDEPGAPALATLAEAPEPRLAWLTRRELSGAVLDRAAHLRRAAGPVRIGVGVPRAAVIELLAAGAARRLPVVTPAELDEDGARRLLAAAARPPSGPGRLTQELVLPTSGSRTAPRAVLRTTRSWAAGLAPFSRIIDVAAMPRAAVWAPGSLGSTLTLWAIWHALASGVPVIVTGPWSATHARAVAESATQRRVPIGWVHTVPAIAEQLGTALADGLLAPGGRLVLGGAAPCPGLLRALRERGIEVLTYYGAAELSFVAYDPDGAGLRPFPGVAVRVLGGEVWAHSRLLFGGYLGEPGTARFDADGWCTVGDVGHWSNDGTLVVRGRGDAAIQIGGTTVLAADVEAVLRRVPGVAEAVCVAEPSRLLGERIVGVIRTADDATRTEGLIARLRAAARAELVPHARPARYVVLDQLPLTGAGKVDRARVATETVGVPR